MHTGVLLYVPIMFLGPHNMSNTWENTQTHSDTYTQQIHDFTQQGDTQRRVNTHEQHTT